MEIKFLLSKERLWLCEERILAVDGYFVCFTGGDCRERTDGLEEIGPNALSSHGNGQKYELSSACDFFRFYCHSGNFSTRPRIDIKRAQTRIDNTG